MRGKTPQIVSVMESLHTRSSYRCCCMWAMLLHSTVCGGKHSVDRHLKSFSILNIDPNIFDYCIEYLAPGTGVI